MSVLFGTALSDEDKKILDWAKAKKKEEENNPQDGIPTVAASPVDDAVLKDHGLRIAQLEAKSKDKSPLDSAARVNLKNTILEETKKSRLQLREALEKKMGEMSAANAVASMKLTAEVGKLQTDVAITNAQVLKNKDKLDKLKL